MATVEKNIEKKAVCELRKAVALICDVVKLMTPLDPVTFEDLTDTGVKLNNIAFRIQNRKKKS